MRKCKKNDDVKKTMREWSAPEINEYSTCMYTEGKIYYSKAETTTKSGKSSTSGPS